MNKPRLKILWSSNAYWSPSGYSNASKDMYQNFRENGWTPQTLAFLDMFGLHGGKKVDEYGYWHYPLMDHTMGSDAMIHHSIDFNADVVISLQDIWPLNPTDLQQLTRFIPWAPIDYEPIPRAISQNLRYAYRIISMSKFGKEQLSNVGLASTLIPHGVFTKVFFPMDKAKRKADVGLDPNLFVYGMVAANKEAFNPRKSFQNVMDAFKKVLEKKPNSLLYMHTDPDFPGGFPLKQYASFLGIAPRVAFPERYKLKYNTPKEEMNNIYNTFDVLLSPSASEGFGIPIIEAQACGVPAIVHNWTAMPELVKDGITGFHVKQGHKIYYPIDSYLCFPDTNDLFDKMMRIQGMKIDEMGRSARKWVEMNFDQDMLFATRWMPFLNKIEREIYGDADAQTDQLTIPQAIA